MDWIIRKLDTLKFHTNLDELLRPLEKEIGEFKWLITDLEINTIELESLPINLEEHWHLLAADEMDCVRKSDSQMIWGVFSALPKDLEINPNLIDLPFADGNDKVWETGNLQLEHSKIEIIAWDSSFTIVKFTDRGMSQKFKRHFKDALPLKQVSDFM